MAIPANANEVFRDMALKDIRLIEIKDSGARIQNREGVKEEVVIGDVIGREGGRVVEIGRAHITIQIDKTRTRIPLIQGFEGSTRSK